MKRLKLIALDEEDLQIVSAHCQDGILKVRDLAYLAGEKRFVVTMNRFVWEAAVDSSGNNERRRAVLHFERVEKVRHQGIDRRNPDQVLDMLAITFHPAQQPAGVIEIAFAGGATLQLTVECIEAQLADLAAAWQAGARPDHETG